MIFLLIVSLARSKERGLQKIDILYVGIDASEEAFCAGDVQCSGLQRPRFS